MFVSCLGRTQQAFAHVGLELSGEARLRDTGRSIVSMEVKADSTEGSFHGTVQAVEKGH